MQGHLPASLILPKKETSDWNPANAKWEYQMRKKEIAALAANYFGDKSDGDTTISADTSLVSTQDGDMIVKNYGNLTVDVGKTLTVANRCRGLLLYVDGDLTVNGKISMMARGCHANPADSGVTSDTPVAPGDGHAVNASGIQIPFLTATDIDTLAIAFEGCGTDAYALNTAYASLVGKTGKLISFPRVGASGGAGIVTAVSAGNNGTAGTSNKTGGGGSGGSGNGAGASADGGKGTCFGGGVGSGGDFNSTMSAVSDHGGVGGIGDNGAGAFCGGGAGNPGGVAPGTGVDGEDGTGGLLIIICSGTVTIGASAYIQSNGKNGGACGTASQGSGAGAGGGAILIAHKGTYTNNGTVEALGGVGGDNGSNDGGDGGAGAITTLQIT